MQYLRSVWRITVRGLRKTGRPATFLAVSLISFCYTAAWAQSGSACDLAAPFGTIDNSDVQAAISMVLGTLPCTANIAGAGVCNAAVVQRVINASLSGGNCVTGPGAVPHSVTLSWTASVSANLSGYNVYRGAQTGGPYTKINSALAAGLTYVDATVVAGQKYYYVTTAVDNTSAESAYSNEAMAQVPSDGGVTIPHSATLSWTASVSPNISGYNVYRGATKGGAYAKLNTAIVAGLSYVDSSVTGGQTYYYVTTAIDSTGSESVYSNEAAAAIPTP